MPKYKVVGSFAVFGNEPGATFDAELDEFDETRLIEGGHIVLVEADEKEAE